MLLTILWTPSWPAAHGRIGRLLLSLLAQWGLLPLPLLYLSAYFHRCRQDYYDLLLGVSERGRVA